MTDRRSTVGTDEVKEARAADNKRISAAAWALAGWLPIETVPDDNPFTCLVALNVSCDPKTGRNQQVTAIGHRYRGVWFANATNNCGASITHWMPLPQPPSG